MARFNVAVLFFVCHVCFTRAMRRITRAQAGASDAIDFCQSIQLKGLLKAADWTVRIPLLPPTAVTTKQVPKQFHQPKDRLIICRDTVVGRSDKGMLIRDGELKQYLSGAQVGDIFTSLPDWFGDEPRIGDMGESDTPVIGIFTYDYLFVVDVAGNMIIAPIMQDSVEIKHSDLTPGMTMDSRPVEDEIGGIENENHVYGMQRGIARAGGEINMRRDKCGKPQRSWGWTLSQQSGYSKRRIPVTPEFFAKQGWKFPPRGNNSVPVDWNGMFQGGAVPGPDVPVGTFPGDYASNDGSGIRKLGMSGEGWPLDIFDLENLDGYMQQQLGFKHGAIESAQCLCAWDRQNVYSTSNAPLDIGQAHHIYSQVHAPNFAWGSPDACKGKVASPDPLSLTLVEWLDFDVKPSTVARWAKERPMEYAESGESNVCPPAWRGASSL